jgi:hypothetical protein
MPIKGKMVAIPYGDRIEAMKIGQVGYIEADDLIVTRDCVFIDILIQVILEENFLKNDDEDTESVNKNCIRVTRIGPGITDKVLIPSIIKSLTIARPILGISVNDFTCEAFWAFIYHILSY